MSALAKKKKGKVAATPPPAQRPTQRPAQRASSGVPPPEAFDRVRRLPPPDLPGPNRGAAPGQYVNTGAGGQRSRSSGGKQRSGAGQKQGGQAQNGKRAPDDAAAKQRPAKRRKPVNPARRRFQRRLMAALLIIGLIGGGVVLSVNLLFKIGGFELEGEVPYSVEQVATAFGHGEGDNMYGFSVSAAAGRITQSLPYIEDITIRRRLPSTIVFKAVPAEEAYCLPWQDGCAVLSASGKVLRLADSAPGGLTRIDGLEGLEIEVGLPLALTEAAKKQSASSSSSAPASSSSGDSSASGDASAGNDDASGADGSDAEGTTVAPPSGPVAQDAAAQGALPADRFAALELLLGELEKSGLEDITWVDVEDPLELRFCWEDRIVVKLGPRSGLEEKLQAAAVLLTGGEQGMVDPKESGTLDMRYYISTGRAVISPE
ncbi:FtsQ-type POTRA domain-containing protein [Ruminococcaceae bacterium OttesenSCG-928-D13]|nr:FtsQ-type POTRA domain-containing protein [Ruminococcaceae bacterium OttesenSCG-928-D13]